MPDFKDFLFKNRSLKKEEQCPVFQRNARLFFSKVPFAESNRKKKRPPQSAKDAQQLNPYSLYD